MSEISKILIVTGLILVIFGLVLKFRFLGLGQLPGDILIKKGNFTFYFPIITCLLISLIITLLFLIFRK